MSNVLENTANRMLDDYVDEQMEVYKQQGKELADKAFYFHQNNDLETAEKILIVDAKYYAHATQSQYGARSQHSGNLYQIFTYVKNKAAMKENPQSVSGLLLYAGTDEEITPNQTYSMSGNRIGVETLDLNQDFSGIRAHLDRIVMDCFGIERTGM